ncbi:type II/IV secretion system protein [Candidatus Azambacteria bacterium]|nr:type II/IV secretion system protein [Candidatus Azambacteria bacterium]
MPPKEKVDISEKLAEVHAEEEEERAKKEAQKLGLGYLDLLISPIDLAALELVSETNARAAGLAVLQRDGRRLDVAVKDPNEKATKAELGRLEKDGFRPNLFLVSKHSLEYAWKRYKQLGKKAKVAVTGLVELREETLEAKGKRIETLEDFSGALAESASQDVAEIIALLLAGALKLDASDIHLEPEEAQSRLRIRLDGMLHDLGALSKSQTKTLTNRIKLLSGLKLNVTKSAQDGRFTIRGKTQDIEVRASAIPGAYGENVVLRVLNPKTISLNLEDLGFREDLLELMKKELSRPTGMILTTGPTGSGKTTTLYAFLKTVSSPDVKIITIEDPIEYHLAGISQTQVEPEKGYTFASGLRSILRQDPDIILVGEIRDKETAETAMHASLTGHLVFSTLHTNDAPGTIPRLIDMGVQPSIVAPAINVALAQRLVRRLCKECAKEGTASAEIIERLKTLLQDLPPATAGPKLETGLKLKTAAGCEACHGLGYKGRVGLFEAFLIDDEMERLILSSPAEADVRALAKKNGMVSMQQDGALKALQGITTLEEVERVMGEL